MLHKSSNVPLCTGCAESPSPWHSQRHALRANALFDISDYHVVKFQSLDAVHSGYTDAGLLSIIGRRGIEPICPIGQIVIEMLFPLINKPLSPYHDADVARDSPDAGPLRAHRSVRVPGTVCIRRGYRPTPVEDAISSQNQIPPASSHNDVR